MSIQRMCPNAFHIKEFYSGYTGTCTQTSAAMCLASAQGTPSDHDGVVNLMLSMTHEMIGRGDNPDTGAGSNGAATVKSMAYELRHRGGTVLTEWDYAGDVMPEDWHTLIKENAGINPILLQLANAQGAWDAAGTREDSGVHYHAIAVLGIADEGYVVGDPNNPSVEQTFDIYPYPALVAASPCGLIMLQTKQEAPHVAIPSNWHDDGTALTVDGSSFKFIGGMRDYMTQLLAAGVAPADDIPLQDEHYVNDNRIEQTTNYHRLVFSRTEANSAWDRFCSNIGAAVLALETKVAALSANPPAPTPSAPSTADTTLAQLKAALEAVLQ